VRTGGARGLDRAPSLFATDVPGVLLRRLAAAEDGAVRRLHTVAAGWTGLFIAAAASGLAPTAHPVPVLLFALADWALFSVYEFSRKTWGREEERDGRDSYSKRLGRGGAVVLSISLAWAAVVLGRAALGTGVPGALWVALSVFPAIAAGPYLFRASASWARTYRTAMQAYLFFFYLAAGLRMVWS